MKFKKCWFCEKESEFDIPGDLCRDHWLKWFDHHLTEEELSKLTTQQIEKLH